MTLIAEAESVEYGEGPTVTELLLRLPPGKMTALIGPLGSGKGAVLRGLARRLQPHDGVVYLDGRALDAWPSRELARELALSTRGLPVPDGITVRQLVRHARSPHQPAERGPAFLVRRCTAWAAEDGAAGGADATTGADAVDRALGATGLRHLAACRLAELSGGERRRAWIALALAQQVSVLLLDEPTTYLDLSDQLEVLELLQRLSAEHRLTIVLVLQDLNQAARYSDWLVAVHDGRLWQAGPPKEVLTAELLGRIFGVRASIAMDPETGAPVCIPHGPLRCERPGAGPSSSLEATWDRREAVLAGSREGEGGSSRLVSRILF